MGRSASHVTLECALKTQPNIDLIGEELEQKNPSLDDIVTYIATMVKNRADKGLNFWTALIPEGLIEFIRAIKKLIQELNDMIAANQKEFDKISDKDKIKFIQEHLGKENAELFKSLPETVSKQLALDSSTWKCPSFTFCHWTTFSWNGCQKIRPMEKRRKI